MKAVKKIFIILFIIVIVVGGLSYLDYFLVKTKGTLPKIAIKKDYKEKEVVEYSAILYKVWYCTADKTTILGDYKDEDPVCPSAYTYVDGYYTNATGIKISQKDIIIMTSKNVYTHEMIDIMSSEEEVSNAVFVAESYLKTFFKEVKDEQGTVDGNSEEYPIVVFPTIEKKDNSYEWVWNTEEEKNYYCINEKDSEHLYSKYEEGHCSKEFEPLRMNTKWCSMYKNSTLVYSEDLIGNLCKD